VLLQVHLNIDHHQLQYKKRVDAFALTSLDIFTKVCAAICGWIMDYNGLQGLVVDFGHCQSG